MLCLFGLVVPGNILGRQRYDLMKEGFKSSHLIMNPGAGDSIPGATCQELSISLPDYFSGRLILNTPYVSNNHIVPYLSRVIDNEESQIEESEFLPDEIIYLHPSLSGTGRTCRFFLYDELKPGTWEIVIPEGYFEIVPEYIPVEEMPLSQEEMLSFPVCSAWHKKGTGWDKTAMFSIHDDDGVDGKIPSCGSSNIPDRNGYFTMLFPLLQSLGVRGNVSMEGWRCGFTANPPQLNDNGKIMLRLEKEMGWEMQSHSMEVLGDQNNNWYVDSLDTPLARQLLEEATGYGPGNITTSVYDAKTGIQFYPNDERTEWVEAPINKIKPYALDYFSKRPVLYIKTHNVEYHWGEWARIAKEMGFRATAWVQHNAMTSHDYAAAVNSFLPYGFNDMPEPYQYNIPPMRSTATRMLLEGQSAPGYIGESSEDNTYDHAQFKWFCNYIDRCVEDGGWIILGLHTYRKCWKNYLEGSLISEGGDYPDEWVDPLQGMDYINDSLLSPPSRLGISDWSEWRPCPGTRLDMVRDLIIRCIDKGMINVTSSEGFEIMGNRRNAGYFNGGVRIGNDKFRLLDDRGRYPHYLEAADGEEFYFQSSVNERICVKFRIFKEEIPNGYSTFTIPGGKVRYYDMNGREVSPSRLGKGFYIRLDSGGYSKIFR